MKVDETIAFDLESHYQKLYAGMEPAFSFRAKTADELVAWQNSFRPRLQQALGLDRMRYDMEGYEPLAERISVEKMDGYTREIWRLWVEPTVALPFYLLMPDKLGGNLPLVLTPHGHSPPHLYVGIYTAEEERLLIEEGDRDIAVQAVKRGYLVIAPTTRGFGDTRTVADKKENRLSSCRTELMHSLLAGRSPIGERVWDVSRLLDWALANLKVDKRRIAITGNSGGGTISMFAAACDQRITVAVPGCYFCTFTGSIASMHHCDCNYVPGILLLGEMSDIAGLVAPRPFCAIAGETDPIFPISEVQKAFKRLRHIYTVAGKLDNCRLYVGNGGHRYYSAGSWPFIEEFFKAAA